MRRDRRFAAHRLCVACVELLDIDATTISLVCGAATTVTLGVSSATARSYGEVAFTLGEGPCLDSVRDRCVVVSTDLSTERRWPVDTPVMLAFDIRGRRCGAGRRR
jgi:hypothetical protein